MRVGSTRREDRGRSAKYLAVARALFTTARDLEAMGEARYGNGLAIIAIHATIAYTDALTVAFRGIRATDGEHLRAVDLLVKALGPRAEAEQIRRLRRILGAKSPASYSGSFYTLDDGRSIPLDLEPFVDWAEDQLTDRRFV